MDTARYKAFMLAADTGSIKNAAEVLGYTPSGVSQLIKNLEEELDLALLIRSKKGVTLTSEGEALMPAVREIINQENRLTQIAMEVKGLTVGSINVAAYHFIAALWMPDLISAFQEKYPNIRIKLQEDTQQGILDSIADRRADVGFLNYIEPMDYQWIPLMDDPMLAVLPANHPYADKKTYPVTECVNERFIMPEHGKDYDVIDMFEAAEINPEIWLSTLDSFTAMAMVERGLGISIMNRQSIINWKRNVAILKTEPSHSIELGIALPSLKTASPATRKFVEFSIEYLKKFDK